MCGRGTLESVRRRADPLPDGPTVARDILASLPERLRPSQPTFDETGGLHAAGLGTLAVLHEVLATSPDAMDLLGEIHHLEPGGEGANQIPCEMGRPSAHALDEVRAARRVAFAAADGRDPILLDGLQQLRPALLQQDFAD